MMFTVQEDSLSRVADSIRKKAGTAEKIAFPAGFVSAIESIETGGGGGGGDTPAAALEPSAVNFFDYDGTLIASYTEAQAKALTELPAPPAHDGLKFQGWNYTLDEVKANADAADIGALYTTTDGKTRLYVDIKNAGNLAIGLNLMQTKAAGAVVEWGDGSQERTPDGTSITLAHTYPAAGQYAIAITVDTDCTLSLGNSSGGGLLSAPVQSDSTTLGILYWQELTGIETGDRVDAIYAIRNCENLEYIAVNEAVSKIPNIASCTSLKFLTMPRGLASMDSGGLTGCRSLHHISIPCTIKKWEQSMSNCTALERFILPPSVAQMNNANDMFQNLPNLQEVVIKNEGITIIGNNMFKYCSKLKKVQFKKITKLGSYALAGTAIETYESTADTAAVWPDALGNCNRLHSVVFGEKITTIYNTVCEYCLSLVAVVCLGAVTEVGYDALKECYSLKRLDLSHCTRVPSLGNSAMFNSCPADFEILVPAALLEDWRKKTNWVAWADHIKGV